MSKVNKSRAARMESQRWSEINARPSSMNLDVTACCTKTKAVGCPIDEFYQSQAGILVLGQPQELGKNHTLGRLLVMGLVTGVESYLRDILFNIGTICPLARTRLADENIAVGALEFYGQSEFMRGLLDGVSLAGSKEIKSKTEKITGIRISDNSSVSQALESFDIVCHLRHAAIHAQGVINRGNARVLGIKDLGVPMHITVDLHHLHQCALACQSFVRDYNSYIFSSLVQKWTNANMLTADWHSDKALYEPLHRVFYSRQDSTSRQTAYTSYASLRPKIIARIQQ